MPNGGLIRVVLVASWISRVSGTQLVECKDVEMPGQPSEVEAPGIQRGEKTNVSAVKQYQGIAPAFLVEPRSHTVNVYEPESGLIQNV